MTQAMVPNMMVEPLLLPVEGFEPAEMPGLRKAAILMLALGDELVKDILPRLAPRDVQRLTDEITMLADVPAPVLTQVATEFYGLLETQQFMVRGGREYAERVLTDAFGAARAKDMMNEVREMQERTTGDIAVLREMDPQQLSKFLENEHPQTIALVLAHLEPERGSTLLMSLQPQLRVEAVRRLAEMRHFSPEMASKVALVLARRMDSLGSSGRRSYSGFKSVADLLNRMDQNVSRTILEGIEQQEPKLAIGIRDLMFTFDDLITVQQSGIREILTAVDKRVLAMALKGSRDSIRHHLFSAMSSRAVEMLQDDMETLGPVRSKDVAAAQQQLLAVARKLEAEGRVILSMESDNDFAV
ncbi:flagellar motor switch protein FliG [Granulicella cerasi]|uniref:Flagellar motor switch protein FliG n=1 Tax=Granulicella cerasi TaxID=741063 RepID=A0ABW1Z3Z8_9BACT|nr:flagellar motor switch protein FliG [Granulicella cerasi]